MFAVEVHMAEAETEAEHKLSLYCWPWCLFPIGRARELPFAEKRTARSKLTPLACIELQFHSLPHLFEEFWRFASTFLVPRTL